MMRRMRCDIWWRRSHGLFCSGSCWLVQMLISPIWDTLLLILRFSLINLRWTLGCRLGKCEIHQRGNATQHGQTEDNLRDSKHRPSVCCGLVGVGGLHRIQSYYPYVQCQSYTFTHSLWDFPGISATHPCGFLPGNLPPRSISPWKRKAAPYRPR